MSLTNYPNGLTSFGIPLVGGMTPSIPNANGQILFVDSSGVFSQTGAQAFPTIQGAINACVSGAGSTVFVFPGTYGENVTVNKDAVALIGAVGAGFNRPDVTPTTGKALVVTGKGFYCSRMRFAANDADSVHQQSSGFFYDDCVFDGGSAQTNVQGLVRLAGSAAGTASEGVIQNSLFRGNTLGIGLIFQYRLLAFGGEGTTDNQILNNRFYLNAVDIKTLTNTNGGGAGMLQDTLIQGNSFETVGAAFVYTNFLAGAAGDLAANSALIRGNAFADLAIVKAQLGYVGNPNIIASGNYDATGLINASAFNT
jgi:hypothetical protein